MLGTAHLNCADLVVDRAELLQPLRLDEMTEKNESKINTRDMDMCRIASHHTSSSAFFFASWRAFCSFACVSIICLQHVLI